MTNQISCSNIKKLKESRERAETLASENTDLERRVHQLQDELEYEKKETQRLKEKQAQQVLNLNRKLDKLKEDLKDSNANKDHAIREQVYIFYSSSPADSFNILQP